jgi:hypothetical protein
LGTTVLLPPGADPVLAEPGQFAAAILEAESRSDAQHARALDVALPRAVAGFELLAGAWVLLPFVRLGMVLQLDAELAPASDGSTNPHIHAAVSMRRLDGLTFGCKERQWNVDFRRLGGREVRARIASRIAAAAAHLSQAVVIDPRSKSAWSNRPIEPRVDLAVWRAHFGGERAPEVRRILASRLATPQEPVAPMQEREIVEIGNPALAGAKAADWATSYTNFVDRARAGRFVLDPLNPQIGDEFELSRDGMNIRLAVDGDTKLRFSRHDLQVVNWSQIVDLVRAVEWPALVVEGSQTAVDELSVRMARDGVVAINHAISPTALAAIALHGPEALLEDVSECDPLGVIETEVLKTWAPSAPNDRLTRIPGQDGRYAAPLSNRSSASNPSETSPPTGFHRALSVGHKSKSENREPPEAIDTSPLPLIR